MTTTPEILEIIKSSAPKADAERFGACLAADRGYSSTIVRESAHSYLCVASDGRAIRFRQ